MLSVLFDVDGSSCCACSAVANVCIHPDPLWPLGHCAGTSQMDTAHWRALMDTWKPRWLGGGRVDDVRRRPGVTTIDTHTHTAGMSLACGCHLQARTCIRPHQLQRAKETWLSRLPTLICTPAVVPPRVERASRSAQAVFRTHDAAFASARGKDATDAGDGASGDLHKRSSTLTSDCTPSTQPSWEGGSQTYSRTLRFAGYSYSTRHPTLIRFGDRPLTFATKNQSVINRGRTLVSCLVGSITQSISLSSDHYIHPFVL